MSGSDTTSVSLEKQCHHSEPDLARLQGTQAPVTGSSLLWGCLYTIMTVHASRQVVVHACLPCIMANMHALKPSLDSCPILTRTGNMLSGTQHTCAGNLTAGI